MIRNLVMRHRGMWHKCRTFLCFPIPYTLYLLPYSLSLLSLSGCGVSYQYYAPPVNNTSFANKNEAHISGQAGITGSAVKFGYALSEKVAFTGTYHTSSPGQYRGKEFETGLMFGKSDSTSSRKNITLGCGFGGNYKQISGATLKDFRGDFVKPFALLTFGTAHKNISFWNFVFVDGAFSLKANYLIYNGYRATTIGGVATEKKFNPNIFFAEPYFNFNVGTKWFRIDFGAGLILKKKYEFDKNLTVLPIEANAGILFVLGRKSLEKKSF